MSEKRFMRCKYISQFCDNKHVAKKFDIQRDINQYNWLGVNTHDFCDMFNIN